MPLGVFLVVCVSHKHTVDPPYLSPCLSEIFGDIGTSTYQICRIEEKINKKTTFHKLIHNLTPEVRVVLKILWKRKEIVHQEQFSFPQYFVTCC